MAHMYILYSGKLDNYYIGAGTDLEGRLYEHNFGRFKYTSFGIPWVVMYKEEYPALNVAKRRETEITKKKSRKHIEELIRSPAGRAS